MPQAEEAQETPFGWPREDFTWLDGDHAYRLIRNPEGEPVGVNEFHRLPEGAKQISATPGWEVGSVYWAGIMPERNRWRLEQLEPLTISPSVLCGNCGEHGFIRDGKWVSA